MLPGRVKIPPDTVDLIMRVGGFQPTIRIKVIYKIAGTGDEAMA